jgi:hypothetical protein
MKPEYDIAISFAGEDRTIAEQIVEALDKESVKVFYDEYEQANLWGKDLYQYLTDTYSKNAEYCIILISEHYPNKNWTKLELKAAQERDFTEDKEYILPVRIDNTQVPGLRNTIGYLDLNKVGVQGVIDSTLKKLGKKVTSSNNLKKTGPLDNNPFRVGSPRMPKFKKEFTDKEKEDFLHEGFKIIKNYFKQGLKSIESNSSEIETSFTEIHALKFTGKIYVNGEQKTKFKIWLHGDDSIGFSDSFRSLASDNSFNETVYIEANENELRFRPMYMGVSWYGHGDKRLLTKQATAEYLWERVMKKIENSY